MNGTRARIQPSSLFFLFVRWGPTCQNPTYAAALCVVSISFALPNDTAYFLD